ncbi:2-dehydropantoate 2-reductase N-terminal domain-containing protein [Azohydromonas sp.]|uniref:ketopantoate reductase family protein n=1 Tax=Azohydromonas sp. TaxID=1872666 RepID=UPI002C90B0A6|nr:2-dehydropantoate 2-reductase N-terminal domain-containing protein [Azohydromonas sp.]HMM85459.1 2-dehydropantoate 2-reductase N-terminal domain-containing protein [Azohydromonas sp.]
MQIVIVGAGGIGGYFGARLAAAGEPVAFLARGRHAQALREQGLRVTSALGDLHLREVAVADDAAGLPPADLVLFAVKLPDAEAAAAALPALVRPGTVVLPLQNGVEVAELLARRVGDDIRRVVWEKFVFLVGLSGLTALTRLPIGATRADPALRRLLRDVMSEAHALACAEGVALGDDFVERQLAFVDTLPAGMKASMLHDLEAGRALELPWLAAAVVRRSERAGLAAPANRFVAAALGPYANGRPAGEAGG